MKRVGPLFIELWLPILLTALFITASFYQEQFVVDLGLTTAAQVKKIFPYVFGIGIWMSLAYLINRLLSIIVWQPLNRSVPVPRVLRDVAALIIYGLAVTGVVGVVFKQPIEPFWAASGVGALVLGLALRNGQFRPSLRDRRLHHAVWRSVWTGDGTQLAHHPAAYQRGQYGGDTQRQTRRADCHEFFPAGADR